MKKDNIYKVFEVVYRHNIFLGKIKECIKSLDDLRYLIDLGTPAYKDLKKAEKILWRLYNYENRTKL